MTVLSTAIGLLALLPLILADGHLGQATFNRIAFFPVCKQLDPRCRTDNVTNAEIIDASKDGMTLVYGDSELGVVGIVDIRDPYNPTGLGIIDVGGEPTSVVVSGDYIIAAVNTPPDFVNASGILHVIDLASGDVLRTMDLGGQPDSVASSPDERFVVIAIENERDEDLGEGGLPQMPAGFVEVLSRESDDVMEWTLTTIELAGLDGLVEADDPEPEYVSINDDNIAVVTLQENNAIVLIDLETMEVTASFTAGTVDLSNIDAAEEGVIYQDPSATLEQLPREPDGVTWISTEYFVTADEGDWNGGTRGFTIYDKEGNIIFTSGDEMETITAMVGHYPEGRSENKGNEPENVAFGIYGDDPVLFVISERSSLVFVYDISDPTAPFFKQVLPAGWGPEGGKAIPQRNLFVCASENDERDNNARSGINIYMLSDSWDKPMWYPTLVSDMNEDGNPIPFSALSGLAAAEPYSSGRRQLAHDVPESASKHSLASRALDGEIPDIDPANMMEAGSSFLYSVEDSFFKKNRIFTIDTSPYPHVITKATRITDAEGVFSFALGEGAMRDALINDDNTVNIDPEGIAVSYKGGFWLAHEGSGTVGDEARPVESPNVLFKLSSEAVIEEVILLPAELNEIQLRFGFEGVAEDGDNVVVCFQRAWGGERDPRIGIYNTLTQEWKFVFYPLGQPESQNGGWVGLSDIAPLGGGQFMVLERDNQGGMDAAIKRLFTIDLGDFSIEDGATIEKHFYKDLMPYIAAYNGAMLEKVEGLAVTAGGHIWINTDNDGVDDSSGEQLLIQIE